MSWDRGHSSDFTQKVSGFAKGTGLMGLELPHLRSMGSGREVRWPGGSLTASHSWNPQLNFFEPKFPLL